MRTRLRNLVPAMAGALTWMVILSGGAAAQRAEQPQPRVVDPGKPGQPPSDAVVLFDGTDLSSWTTRAGGPSGCTVAHGEMVCKTGSKDSYSKQKFRNAQIHVEFALPSMPERRGQSRGNSGVYLHGLYEIQILDSYQNSTYPNGSSGALYGQAIPLVNASRMPEQWQTYDIIFHAPKCDAEGRLVEYGTLTLLYNGVLVQDHVKIWKAGPRNLTDQSCVTDKIGEPGPLMLQDHNYRGAPMTTMRFRNIWFRPVEEPFGRDAGTESQH